jgi:hypothetical protein
MWSGPFGCHTIVGGFPSCHAVLGYPYRRVPQDVDFILVPLWVGTWVGSCIIAGAVGFKSGRVCAPVFPVCLFFFSGQYCRPSVGDGFDFWFDAGSHESVIDWIFAAGSRLYLCA